MVSGYLLSLYDKNKHLTQENAVLVRTRDSKTFPWEAEINCLHGQNMSLPLRYGLHKQIDLLLE